MGIRRHTDDKRAAASTKPISPTARAKLGGVIERWKEQLAAGEDLTETSEPSIDDENGGRFPPRSRDGNPSYFDPRSAIALRNRDRACRKRRREPGRRHFGELHPRNRRPMGIPVIAGDF
jgi:hypothetical protein